MNQVMLTGWLWGEPDLGVTADGRRHARMVVATRDKDRKDPEWHCVVAYDEWAELVETAIRKGMYITLRGWLRTRTPKGGKHRVTEIVVDEIEHYSVGGREIRQSEPEAQQKLDIPRYGHAPDTVPF